MSVAKSIADSTFVSVAASVCNMSSGNLGVGDAIPGTSGWMAAARHSKTRLS